MLKEFSQQNSMGDTRL